MKRHFNSFYWFTVTVLLILIYGSRLNGFVVSFYFVSFLVPVVIATSVYFNNVLVSEYLLKKRYARFIFLTIAGIIISLDLLWFIFFIAFYFMARFQPDNIVILINEFSSFPLVLYLSVIVNGFLNLSKDYLGILEDNKTLEARKNDFSEGNLQVRANRQNRIISFKSINYIESMSDYVLIRAKDNETVITRETISRIEQDLPSAFLRIHRSFIVNLENVESFTREFIMIAGMELPISRTYRKKVYEILKL
ncbi:MAG: LytTR family transcriptional regulator DNA-binding domain-containing protein [Bacteroidales bacterium]|nr:LytTR family transcriptional regulator DNA-binding domain-containing protein [Bacteroidales bacterium]MCF8389396.1 LytTR family transcriptional regulator DNA-binding domain-containing protein [Bacteroidales bacterium]